MGTILRRIEATGFLALGTGWDRYVYGAGLRPLPDGDRPYASIQGGNALEVAEELAAAARARLAEVEPAAIVHVDARKPTWVTVSIELHGDAIGLPNNGPTHRDRKVGVARVLWSIARTIEREEIRLVRGAAASSEEES